MSAPAAVHVAESTHWYGRDGQPCYEVPAKNGQPRPTTLRDARKMELVPGVTTVIKCAAAPGLENWKIDQGILAALTLPRGVDEAEADWLVRVKRDAQEQGRAAAERGTEIHAAIEAYYANGLQLRQPITPELVDMVRDVDAAIDKHFGICIWDAERTLAHQLGFGGKADLVADNLVADKAGRFAESILLDVKTKDAWAEGARLHWDEHAIQLAAYRVGLGRPDARCANVFVSREEPWQVHIHEWTEDDLARGWRMFTSLLAYWKAKSNYDVSWDAELEDAFARPF